MFFVNTDYSKEIQKAKIHLSKPNKTIISHIFEKQNTNLSVKLGNIYELTFSIPHFINGEHEIEKNPHTETIKEKMLLRVTLSGMTEWFIVDSIEEDGSDTDIFNVTAFSLGYELSHKRISSYIGEGKSCKAMATEILESSTWRVGTIDAEIQYRNAVLTDENETKRTLEINGSNALDGILQIAEAFNAVPIWDTENKTVSFKSLKNIGIFKGLTLNYGKLLSSINRSRTTDEMVTRMYAYGNEDLTIAGVNPTGQMYIEDFSFFMYPFERDENKNVISSSHFMSDALCHAILNHKELVQTRSPEINSLMNDILSSQSVLQTLKTDLTELQLELQSIEYRLDTAKASEDQSLIARIESERVPKLSEISAQEVLIEDLNLELEAKDNRVKELRDSISSEAGFNTALYDELNYYIIEREWRDDRYINADELYEDALDRFATLREPKVVVTVDIDNLFEVMDEQYYWDKLELGDLIKIKYPQMNIEYMAQIIEINYDFEGGSISIVIANTEKTGNEMDRLKELLSKSQSASTLLENNKYKWDKVVGVEDEVYRLINSEWDANKRKIIAGVNNQIEIGNRGIIVRNPDNPDDVVIMQSGIIALSKDGGDTWKTAIKPDGIVAERIIGNLIAGRNLVITNGNGTFTVDEDGVRVVGTSLEILGGLPASQLDQDYVNDVNLQILEAREATEQLELDVSNMFGDSVLTQLESITLKLSLKRVMSESLDALNIASELGIVDERNNYDTALKNLESHLKSKYIDKDSSAYPITVSQTDRNIIENHFTTVEEAKSVLTNKIVKERESNAISKIDELKNSINVEIDEVKNALDNMDDFIGDSFKDGIIEEAEAKSIEKYINILNTEKADIDSKYDSVYKNPSLVDENIKSSLLNSKNSYNTAHTNLINSINTAIADGKTTEDEKKEVDNRFNLYKNTMSSLSSNLEKALDTIAIEKAKVAENNAKLYADQMKTSIDNELSDVKNVLENIDNFIGDSFKDGIIEEVEAKAIATYLNSLSTEKADLDNRYLFLYDNKSLADSNIKSSLLSSKTAYNTAHNNLLTAINNAINDRKATEAEKTNIDNKFALYKTALSNLSTALEKAIDSIAIEKARVAEVNAKNASVGKGEVLNGVKIDSENGIVVTTSDLKTRVVLNASNGFNIQKNTGSTSEPKYSDIFYINADGNVQLKSGVISWGDVNTPTATDIGALPTDSQMLTKITSSGVYTGSITTNQLTVGTTKISTAMIENLVVGTNVSMGANASISWNNITSKPTIPTSASQIGALPSTYIDSTGVWTGKINANTITSGTLSADRINGGTISGVTISGVTISGANITGGNIKIDTNAYIGDEIYIGANVYKSNGVVEVSDSVKYINFRSGRYGSAEISFHPAYETLALSCLQAVEINSGYFNVNAGYIDFSNAIEIRWGNNKPTAVFG